MLLLVNYWHCPLIPSEGGGDFIVTGSQPLLYVLLVSSDGQLWFYLHKLESFAFLCLRNDFLFGAQNNDMQKEKS